MHAQQTTEHSNTEALPNGTARQKRQGPVTRGHWTPGHRSITVHHLMSGCTLHPLQETFTTPATADRSEGAGTTQTLLADQDGMNRTAARMEREVLCVDRVRE